MVKKLIIIITLSIIHHAIQKASIPKTIPSFDDIKKQLITNFLETNDKLKKTPFNPYPIINRYTTSGLSLLLLGYFLWNYRTNFAQGFSQSMHYIQKNLVPLPPLPLLPKSTKNILF